MANDVSGRTGRWLPAPGIENLPDRFRKEGAFLPRPLPSDVSLRTSTDKLVADTHHLLGRLEEIPARLPDWSLLVKLTRWWETKSTLGLSGTHVEFREMFMLDLPDTHSSGPVNPRVAACLQASEDAVRRVLSGEPVAATLLGPTAVMLAGLDSVPSSWSESADAAVGGRPGVSGAGGVRPGEVPWRTRPIWLGAAEVADAALIAVPPGAELHAATEQWAAWVDSESDMPWTVKVALGFYQIMTLSPVENTGYLARLYVALEFIRAGVLRDQILPVSVWLDRVQDHYWRRHRAMVEDGDLDEWVVFVASGISQLCRNQINLVQDLERLRENHMAKLIRTNDALARIVSGLIGSPITNHKHIVERFGVTVRHSRDLVKQLIHVGLIREVGKRKQNKLLEVPDVVQLLSLYEGMHDRHDRTVFTPRAD